MDTSAPPSDGLADIDDEEKARAIAEQDLRGSRKQVSCGLLSHKAGVLTKLCGRLLAVLCSSG